MTYVPRFIIPGTVIRYMTPVEVKTTRGAVLVWSRDERHLEIIPYTVYFAHKEDYDLILKADDLWSLVSKMEKYTPDELNLKKYGVEAVKQYKELMGKLG